MRFLSHSSGWILELRVSYGFVWTNSAGRWIQRVTVQGFQHRGCRFSSLVMTTQSIRIGLLLGLFLPGLQSNCWVPSGSWCLPFPVIICSYFYLWRGRRYQILNLWYRPTDEEGTKTWEAREGANLNYPPSASSHRTKTSSYLPKAPSKSPASGCLVNPCVWSLSSLFGHF